MAKKKTLRRRLLGSTKTGRLVRAASLAGVLGGGGYLASRPRGGIPSVPSPPAKASSFVPKIPASAATPPISPSTPKSSRPRGGSGARNPVKHSNKVTTVRGLNKRLDKLRTEKSSLTELGSKDARKGINRGVKDKIVAAKARLKEIPRESVVARQRIRSKSSRQQQGGWISPVKGTRRQKRRTS